MTTKAKFKSDAYAAIHTSASALLKIGAISKATMRSLTKNCLVEPARVRALSQRQIIQNAKRETLR
jgi:putative transcriptional regulator